MRIIAADTGVPHELHVGDSVELVGPIRLYNGGKIIHGPRIRPYHGQPRQSRTFSY